MTASEFSSSTIGILGCGPLGRQLGHAVLGRGLELCVFDTTPEKCDALVGRGARFAAGGQEELAEACDLILSALTDGAAVETAFLASGGLARRPASCRMFVELSTASPGLMRRIAEELASSPAAFLDGAAGLGADERRRPRLVLWMSGPAREYARVQLLLESMSFATMFCGPVGSAQVVKLVNNSVAHGQLLILIEALTVGVRSGVPLDTLVPALSLGTGHSRLLQEVLPRGLFRGDFTPGLRLAKAREELEAFIALAESAGVEAEHCARARASFLEAEAEGLGEMSCHAVARRHEKRTGTALRLGPAG